ncbi:MAG: methyltransferase domain-containing protein [Pseudomonadota bacterium]
MINTDDVRCNLCGCREFGATRTHPTTLCRGCNSYPRTRFLYLYLERFGLAAHHRVLHLAPERSLYAKLRKTLDPERYVQADIAPENYGFAHNVIHLDLCALDDQPSEQFDVIINSHVLEHTPCNLGYTLFHLHRMLKPEGRHFLIVPFSTGTFEESYEAMDEEERIRRFNQDDHVRRFGRDGIKSHLGALLRLPEYPDARVLFRERVLREANLPRAEWLGWKSSTVMELRRDDMVFFAYGAGAAGPAPEVISAE